MKRKVIGALHCLGFLGIIVLLVLAPYSRFLIPILLPLWIYFGVYSYRYFFTQDKLIVPYYVLGALLAVSLLIFLNNF